MAWTAFIDGGSRGNPGPAAAGVHILDESGRVAFAGGFFLGPMTNNQAEYRGLLAALEHLIRAGAKNIDIVSDSELLVRQINGQYRVKSPVLRPLFDRAQERLARFASWQIRHVMREDNVEADGLANQAMDGQRDVLVTDALGLATGDAPAEESAAEPARDQCQVEVIVVCGADPSVCPAGVRKGQRHTFSAVTPGGLCLEASEALVSAARALLVHRSSSGHEEGRQTVRCDRAGCGAVFELTCRSS